MMINGTLFVQILNFCVTWVVVRYLFVQPAIAVRTALLAARDLLINRKQALDDELRALHDKRYSLWHTWYLRTRGILQTNSRTIPTLEPRTTQAMPPELPAHEIENSIELLSTLIVNTLGEKT